MSEASKANRYEIFDTIVDNYVLEKVKACCPHQNLTKNEHMLELQQLGQVKMRIYFFFSYLTCTSLDKNKKIQIDQYIK